MDFSTRFNLNESLPKTADISRADWLRLAIAVAAAQGGERMFSRGCYPENAKPCRADALTPRRYLNSPHGHAYLEICLNLFGTSSMVMDEKVFNFQEPAMMILQPGVPHCEGYAQVNRRYAVMWMSCTGSSLMAAISAYNRRNRWSCPQRWDMQSPSVGKFMARFPAFEPGAQTVEVLSRECREHIRAGLIIILSELLQKTAAPPSGKAARHGRHQHDAMLRNLQTFINHHLADPLSAAYLASLAHMSPNYLNSLFVRWAGQPLRSYIISCRMKKARQLLQSGEWMVKEVAAMVGYDDALYFSRAFKKYFDLWPTDVIEGR